MSDNYNSEFGGEMKRGQSWFIPLEILAVIVVLGAIALWFLTGPSIDLTGNTVNPTSSTDPVDLSIDGYSLAIPANLLPLGRNRAGGEQEDIRLHALLPDMRGWSSSDSSDFGSNAPDSRVVQIVLTTTRSTMSEKERFERVLKPYTVNPEGEAGPHGLTKYAFTPGQGYDGTELFTFAAGEGALIVLQCEIAGDNATGPACWRTTKPQEKDTVAITYRFKRAHLPDWPAIDQGVMRLIASFHQKAGT
jgi:type II secretory pathway pseudopilin PulG